MFHPLGNQQVNFGSQEGPSLKVSPPLLHLLKMSFFEPEKLFLQTPILFYVKEKGNETQMLNRCVGFLLALFI